MTRPVYEGIKRQQRKTPKGTPPAPGRTRPVKPGRGRPAKGWDPVTKEWRQ